MVHVRNFTLQKYIFHTKFTNVKSEFFLKNTLCVVIDFGW
jgi:hypothetical protein